MQKEHVGKEEIREKKKNEKRKYDIKQRMKIKITEIKM